MTDTRSWLERDAHQLYAYLTTTGRRTGRPHRIEIWFAVEGDRMFMMAGGRDTSDWIKNLMAEPQVQVELGGQTRSGVAVVIDPESPDDELARNLLFNKYRKGNELDDWRVRSLPVVITFAASDE